MEPESEERLASRGFGLSNLVLMMGEYKIVATSMDVAMFAKVVMRKHDAFGMPTGATFAPRRIPLWLAGLGGFPKREVERILLLG